jgi:hypothetical protein
MRTEVQIIDAEANNKPGRLIELKRRVNMFLQIVGEILRANGAHSQH